MSPKLIRRIQVTILVIVGLLLTIRFTHYLVINNAYQQLQQQSQRQLSGLVTFLDGMLQRFESMPQLLSQNISIRKSLAEPDNQQATLALNRYLEQVNRSIHASDIYLINEQGFVLAASNWQLSHTFVNSFYGFRPYFTQAIAGKQGRYFAVGTRSNRRGYYFSYPVSIDGKIRGVVVVKVDVAQIEQYHGEVFAGSDSHFLITADDGVIFVSDQAQWRMKTLGPISPAQRQLIKREQRYATRRLSKLPLLEADPFDYPPQAQFKVIELQDDQYPPHKMLSQQRKMNDANWLVHIWLPLDKIQKISLYTIVLSAAFYLLVVMALFFGLERWRNIIHLRKARAELEQRVDERTSALSASNKLLRDEIDKKKLARQQLKATQEQLIQAAKLALIGEMSASINHEINQPLTAIRSYSQNAKTMLDRNMPDKAAVNLDIILELVDRLASIVGQFKNFTRKSVQSNNALEIQHCIEQAHTIVTPLLNQHRININFELPSATIYAVGDHIRLEQVLVNLITNASEAMIASSDKSLWLTVTVVNASITIELRDSGPGILETEFSELFETFYTNRRSASDGQRPDSGPGLGLGLSICKRIIESMNGQITVTNHPLGGAVFSINLPEHQPCKDA